MTIVPRKRISTLDPSRLTLEVSSCDGKITTVHCEGELDIYTSAWFYELVENHLTSEQPSIIIDLTKTGYIDGHSWGVLVKILKKAKALGGNICIVFKAEPSHVQKIFEMSGLNKVFSHQHTITTAMQFLLPA